MHTWVKTRKHIQITLETHKTRASGPLEKSSTLVNLSRRRMGTRVGSGTQGLRSRTGPERWIRQRGLGGGDSGFARRRRRPQMSELCGDL